MSDLISIPFQPIKFGNSEDCECPDTWCRPIRVDDDINFQLATTDEVELQIIDRNGEVFDNVPEGKITEGNNVTRVSFKLSDIPDYENLLCPFRIRLNTTPILNLLNNCKFESGGEDWNEDCQTGDTTWFFGDNQAQLVGMNSVSAYDNCNFDDGLEGWTQHGDGSIWFEEDENEVSNFLGGQTQFQTLRRSFDIKEGIYYDVNLTGFFECVTVQLWILNSSSGDRMIRSEIIGGGGSGINIDFNFIGEDGDTAIEVRLIPIEDCDPTTLADKGGTLSQLCVDAMPRLCKLYQDFDGGQTGDEINWEWKGNGVCVEVEIWVRGSDRRMLDSHTFGGFGAPDVTLSGQFFRQGGDLGLEIVTKYLPPTECDGGSRELKVDEFCAAFMLDEGIDSNCFTLSKDTCLKELVATNDRDAFRFDFSEDWEFKVRLKAFIRNVSYPEDRILFDDSNGIHSLQYDKFMRRYDLIIEQIPSWMHDAVRMMLACDSFYIQGRKVFKEQGDYSPTWDKRNPLASVTVRVVEDTDMINSPCLTQTPG